jgi:hypothetical protein
MTRRSRELDLLLSTRPLEGNQPAGRMIGPELLTSVVDGTSLQDAREAIGEHCCFWGGGCSILIPADPAVRAIEQPWLDLVRSNRLDHVAGRGKIDDDEQLRKTLDVRADFAPLTEPLFTMLLANPLEDEYEFRVALPVEDDPWWVAYAATLGVLPAVPPADLAQRSALIPDIEWKQLANITFEEVPDPSLHDLIDRLRARDTSNVRALSLHKLGIQPAPWSQDLLHAPVWVQRDWSRLHVGSNIAVVYEPGSVPDLCLLWTLRSAHGLPSALPLAVPITADVVAELDSITNLDGDGSRFAATLRGFGRPWTLISASVEQERLEEIAAGARGEWAAFSAGEILQPPTRPARYSAEIAHFADGTATVSVWDPTDREIVSGRPGHAFGLSLRGNIVLPEKRLPAFRTLRGHAFTGGGWIGGGYDFQVHERSETLPVPWPSSWALLRAAAADQGLRVRPSRPGQAAAALLERIGSFTAVDALKDERILDELDRLGEREGISWFRRRIREIQANLAERSEEAGARSARLEQLVEDLVVPPVDDEQHELEASKLAPILGASRARTWLSWAENAGLIVRGARVECRRCGTKSWRPARELAPPVVCGGCGEPISQPFPADQLRFRYRASRLLLEVQAADALPHILCAAWWTRLFERGGLVGMYPGVEFLEEGGKSVLGEMDVVLLLLDGTMALGEVKRRPAGLTQKDLDGLDALAERTFVATPGWAAEAPEIWRTLRRELPERRRFALCGEQLLTPSVQILNLLGHDPTAWSPADEEARETHRNAYREKITDVISSLEHPRSLADWLIPG